MSDLEVFLQQMITGITNGMIIALIALGYTMVYGIVELINFAHGDLFMLGAFFALTLVGCLGLNIEPSIAGIALLIAFTAIFCGGLNWLIDRYAYRPLRSAPRLVPLVSAIGVSFICLNVGLFWGGLPLEVFGNGAAAAAPKDFPELISSENLLSRENAVRFTGRDLLVFLVTLPVLGALAFLIKFTKIGRAMRSVALNPLASKLMGVNVDRVIGQTFVLGGVLAGVASVVYSIYNNTIYFQMGYRVGMDAFTAAVLGGIGNLWGATLGGLLIGIVRAMSDQYIASEWSNFTVFVVLIFVLIFRPTGILGAAHKDKV